jgi:spermidine synthase
MTRFTALLLTVLTGFTGLVYEVAWQKYLATLLGSHAEATAAVLAIFLGGLSVGYALFGSATRRLTERAHRSGIPPQLLRFYGLIEAGIGIYALLFPTLFGVVQSISLLTPFHAGLAFAFDVLLTVLLIGPPAVLMGGTIPILTLALAGDLQHATRVHAWVYGFNTVGAFAGALAGGFYLVPLLGLDGVLYAMGGINLFAGAVFIGLDRLGARVAPDLVGGTGSARAVRGFAGYAAIALLGGFAMMAVQTTLNRIGGLAFGASHFTFAMVVAVFVLCIALGSLAVSMLRRISPLLIVGSQWLLVFLLVLLYFQLPNTTYYAHLLRMVFRNHYVAFYPYYFAAFVGALLTLLIPIGLSGALLPLLFHHLRREVGTLGSIAGRLYSWNTVGSLLGALLGGYILLFWIDLQQVYCIALAALILAAGILTVLVTRVSPVAVALVVVLPGIAGLASLPDWQPNRLGAGLFRVRTPQASTFVGADGFFRTRKENPIIFQTDDPNSTVTIREGPRMGTRLNRTLFTNGKSDGNLVTDYATMALAGLVPALLAENIERCFVIGFGLGVTTGELAALQGTREVRVAEISQGVIEAAPLFDEGNLRASRSPKVSFDRSDAYRALLRSEGQWDVIASEPSNPWVTGVEMLYSLEFLQAVRQRLAPGGVFAQWFHLYELDEGIAELVLRNYAAAFPHVSVWFTMSNDVLLVAFDRPERALDLEALGERYRQPDFAAGFGRVGVESFAALLTHEQIPLGTLQAADLKGVLHTLRHPILSHLAAQAFFRGGVATIPKFVQPRSVNVGAKNSLLLRYANRRGGIQEDVLEAATRETCRLARAVECGTFFAYWRHTHPDSERLSAALARARNPDPNQSMVHESMMRESIVGITDAKLSGLAGLYGAKSEIRGRPLPRAVRTTTDYVTHFQYAVPFERSVLESAWAKCTGPPCAPALRVAEEKIGPLTGRAAPRTERRAPE